MDLVFTPAEVLAVVVAVFITDQIASDGESNWLEGAQLLAVYLILAIVFYFLPETAACVFRTAGVSLRYLRICIGPRKIPRARAGGSVGGAAPRQLPLNRIINERCEHWD